MQEVSVEQDDEPESEAGETAMGSANTRVPPYVAYSTLLTLFKELKDNGLPPQLDKSVLKRFAFGIQGQLKMALRSLGMLDGDKPTPRLKSFVDSYETDEFGPLLLAVLKEVYPYVFALDLSAATPTMLADAFKSEGGVKGEDSLRKCRAFFMNAAKAAGVEFGPRLANGTVPRSPSAPRRKPRAKAKEPETLHPEDSREVKRKEEKRSGKDHPLVDGLLLTLPVPGKKWDVDARISWLRMAAFIFENIDEGKGSIKIETEKQAATDQ
jgi:hypothetical protein